MQKSDNEETFEVDTTVFGGLKVRKGFEKYGAKAVFAMDRKIKYIYVCEYGKNVFPGDEEWEHAKWIWRVSVLAHVTIGPHLTQLHWTIVSLKDHPFWREGLLLLIVQGFCLNIQTK